MADLSNSNSQLLQVNSSNYIVNWLSPGKIVLLILRLQWSQRNQAREKEWLPCAFWWWLDRTSCTKAKVRELLFQFDRYWNRGYKCEALSRRSKFLDNLLNLEAKKAIIVFRCGFNGLLRLNFEQTIDFYNKTVSSKTLSSTAEVKWRRAEFFIDWSNKEITYYYKEEGTSTVTAPFFYQDLSEVNGLMLYNLKPGTVSYFKDLKIDTDAPTGRTICWILETNILLVL